MTKILFIQGLSGSGKTTLSRQISHITSWPILDRDEMNAGDDRALAYKRLKNRAGEIVSSGNNLIIDAPFLFELKDGSFPQWVDDLGDVEAVSIWLEAGEKELVQRRNARGLGRDLVDLEKTVSFEKRKYGSPEGPIYLSSENLGDERLLEAALWLIGFEDRRIEKGGPESEDLKEEILLLKKEISDKCFPSFLDSFQLQRKIDYDIREIDRLFENDLYLAFLGSDLVALGAVENGKIFSDYSKAHAAGDALLALRIKDERDKGVKYFSAEVFSENPLGKDHFRRAQFIFSNKTVPGHSVPEKRLEKWYRHF